MSSAKPYYDAEHEVDFMLKNGGTVKAYGSTFTLPEERKFGDIAGVKAYLAKVCEFLDLGTPPDVKPRRGEGAAHYNHGSKTIFIPDHRGSNHSWGMRELVVLHELAHHLTVTGGHGPVWAGWLLYLTEKCIGPEVAFLLMAAFSERGVQIKQHVVS